MHVVVALLRFAAAAFAVMGLKGIWLEGDMDGLVYFTNQSNIMFAVVMIWGGVASLRHARQPPAWFKGAVVVFLTITALVSYLILAPEAPDAPALFLGLTGGQIKHQLTPLLVLLDFTLIDPHRRLRWGNAALWLTYLLAYVTFTTIRGELLAVPDYPYSFVDLAELGWGGLLTNVAAYGVAFYVLGLAFVGIDRAMPARACLGAGVDGRTSPT